MRPFKSRISIIVTVVALIVGGFSQAQGQHEADKTRPHVQQQQYCYDCHQCKEPTASAPCLQARKAGKCLSR